MRLAAAHAVGGHEQAVADLEGGVHHLVAGQRGAVGAFGAFGTVFVFHEKGGFGAERAAVERERFLGAAFEEEVGLDLLLHGDGSFLTSAVRFRALCGRRRCRRSPRARRTGAPRSRPRRRRWTGWGSAWSRRAPLRAT